MGHTRLSLFLLTCLTILVLPAASSPIYQLGEAFTFFATWGKGKYKLDLEVYHREAKPVFLIKFREAYTARSFNGLCGTNPDFDIDKNGIVFPSAVRGRDGCTRARFNLDLGEVVLDHQRLTEFNDFEDDELNGEVSIFETWGTGKYKLDLAVYHRDVKPIFLTTFRGKYGTKKFNDMCGTNPDFDVDKNGWVWPNAVKGKNCSKKDYILDLGDVIKSHQPKEEISDESVISRLENVIKVSKLQDLVFFILNLA
ncbi:hypothetical protein K443DRAFT_369036 [Laccaria amethystina LaAM-08-1]|uniref:Calreticulin n=1 Tax=Laccaria amethystina LaAM-08-1 TaxID=1095629 RepID=A0A0C9XD64_9AGAR|nr:hypothetical protein K443DRAFT_369036 [Laccaria amethystina LaAM-08-1]